jgi:hypothetical protein
MTFNFFGWLHYFAGFVLLVMAIVAGIHGDNDGLRVLMTGSALMLAAAACNQRCKGCGK